MKYTNMVQRLMFYSFKMSRVSYSRNIVGIHKWKAMEKALVLFINGLSTLVGWGLGTTWMLFSFAKAFSEGVNNAAIVDTQPLQLPADNTGRMGGRQALMVETKTVREGLFALAGWTKKWVWLGRKTPPPICHMNPFIYPSNPISKHLITRQYEAP